MIKGTIDYDTKYHHLWRMTLKSIHLPQRILECCLIREKQVTHVVRAFSVGMDSSVAMVSNNVH